MAKLGDGAAVKTGGSDDVFARPHQREKRHDLRRMARGTADRADAAFKRGDPLLQDGVGGVGQARIDIADFLQVKERRRVVGIAKDIGRGLVNRRLPRTRGRVRVGTGMDLQRVEMMIGAIGHWSVLSEKWISRSLGAKIHSDNGGQFAQRIQKPLDLIRLRIACSRRGRLS